MPAVASSGAKLVVVEAIVSTAPRTIFTTRADSIMAKAFVCSIPKSGTYFVAEILKQLGMRASNLHIGTHEFANYGAVDLETCRRDPKRLLVSEPIESSIKRIGEGEFAVGHLPIETAPLLRDFRIIFVCRNVRDVLVSFCRWIAATGRDPDGGDWRDLPDGPNKLLGFLDRRGDDMHKIISLAQDWGSRGEQVAQQVTFEDLMGDCGKKQSVRAVRRIAAAAGREVSDAESLAILKQAKAEQTLTRSTGRTNRQLWWDGTVEQEYRRLGFHEINERLGYADRRSLWAASPLRKVRLAADPTASRSGEWRRLDWKRMVERVVKKRGQAEGVAG